MTPVLTVPPACPRCRGTGQNFLWLDAPRGVEHLEFWRLYAGVGFLRIPCLLCGGPGTLVLEGAPSVDPAEWEHRVPPGATDGS